MPLDLPLKERGMRKEAGMGTKILAFIDTYIKEHGYSPNMREIGDAVGISSTSHVSYWIDRLIEQGKLTKTENIARSVRVVGADE